MKPTEGGRGLDGGGSEGESVDKHGVVNRGVQAYIVIRCIIVVAHSYGPYGIEPQVTARYRNR